MLRYWCGGTEQNHDSVKSDNRWCLLERETPTPCNMKQLCQCIHPDIQSFSVLQEPINILLLVLSGSLLTVGSLVSLIVG
jgi:hypothetical protein